MSFIIVDIDNPIGSVTTEDEGGGNISLHVKQLGVQERVIADGLASGSLAKVGNSNQLYTSVVPADLPPANTPNRYRHFSEYLRINGWESNNLNVNGSSTPVEFSLFAPQASDTYDIYIRQLLIWITDGNVSASKFGALAALGTGFDLSIRESGNAIQLIDKAKSVAELIRYSFFGRPFGTNGTTAELTNTIGSQDTHVSMIDFGSFMPYGLRLGRGSSDEITAIVNDDLRGLTEFYCQVVGYTHHEV